MKQLVISKANVAYSNGANFCSLWYPPSALLTVLLVAPIYVCALSLSSTYSTKLEILAKQKHTSFSKECLIEQEKGFISSTNVTLLKVQNDSLTCKLRFLL